VASNREIVNEPENSRAPPRRGPDGLPLRWLQKNHDFGRLGRGTTLAWDTVHTPIITRRGAAIVALVAVSYVITGWIGLQLPYYGRNVTLVWPPVGIALAAILLCGAWVAPGIVIGAFVVSALTTASPAACAGITIGNTIGPLTAAWALQRKCDFHPRLDRFRDALLFLAIGCLACSLVTATVGTLTLVATGIAPLSDAPAAWLSWVAGDSTGVLVVGAPLLVWLSSPGEERPPRSSIEAFSLVATLFFLSTLALIYGQELRASVYLYLPFGLWSAVRFGLRGCTAAALAVAIIVVCATAAGIGPFAGAGPYYDSMIAMWSFITAVPGCGLLLAAVVNERDDALAHKDRLMRELDHRVKNSLALVTSIAEQSGLTSDDVSAFVDTFARRVRALARSHEALARSHWQGAGIEELVREVTGPYVLGKRDAIAIEGPGKMLSARSAAPIAMILHELATNAAKHGAWSEARGKVAVGWSLARDGGLHLTWAESSRVAQQEPAPRGFGLTIVAGLVEHELGGTVRLDFAERGLVCTLDIPRAGLPPYASAGA